MVGVRMEKQLAQLKVWALLARIGLAIFLVLALLLAVASGFLALQEFGGRFSLFRFYQVSVAIWLLIGSTLAGVPTLVWVWRAHANLHGDLAEGLNFSPGWAVASFFVPVMNLFVPMRAMRELWNRSHGEPSWFAASSVDTVSSWWTCLIAGTLIQTYLTAIALLQLLTPFRITTPPGVDAAFTALSLILLEAAGWFLFKIITRITRAQHEVTSVGDAFD